MIWWQYWPYWIWVSKWPGNNIDPTGSVVLWKIPFFRWVWSPFPSWWTISPRYRWRRRTLSHNRLSFLSWAWRSVSALRWHGRPNSFVCLFSWKDKSYVTNYGATLRLTLSLYAVTICTTNFRVSRSWLVYSLTTSQNLSPCSVLASPLLVLPWRVVSLHRSVSPEFSLSSRWKFQIYSNIAESSKFLWMRIISFKYIPI